MSFLAQMSSVCANRHLAKVILAVCAILLIGTGCKREDGIVRLKLWHQMQPEDRAVLEQVISAYDVVNERVQVEVIYRETEDLRSSFQSAALAGLGPDLIYGPSDQVGPFATMGFIRPMEEFVPQERRAAFDQRAVVQFRGHIYQIADRVGNHLTLVYNSKLLPKPPQTTDELIAMGKAATKDQNGDGVIDQWGIVWNFTEPFFFIPWFSGFGGWVFDEQGKPTLNTTAAVNAFRFVKSLRDEHKIIPPDCDYNTADVLFKEGRAAMLINGPWSWAGYGKAGIPYELARIPEVSSTNSWPAPMVSPLGYSINTNTKGKNLEEAARLLEYLISDSVQQEFVNGTGIIPSSLALREDSLYLQRPHMEQSLAQLEVGRAMPIVPELRAVWDAMKPAYQSVLNGQLSPEQAAAQMQKDAEQKIREMNE
jgi:arabinogalactan oligomer/maltooligosaccharide transport system permease protein